jgi:hypothetical protein
LQKALLHVSSMCSACFSEKRLFFNNLLLLGS